jgi:hypothetical protein
MGRTRTNKIVVFEGNENLMGELLNVRIERANGFSLYGMPIKAAHAFGLPSLERKPEVRATLAF